MKAYFSLQYKRTNRKLNDFGFNPWLTYILGIVGFVVLSKMLFIKYDWAPYVYPFIALIFVLNIGNLERNDFLKNSFVNKLYRQIRFTENALLALPFCLYQFFEQQFLFGTLTFAVAVLLSFFNTKRSASFVVLTPFRKRPFEFIVGFRKTFFVFPILYALVYIAISVGNFNLGVFALVVGFLVCLAYYVYLEPVFYVWVSALSIPEFLKEKAVTGLLYSLLLSLPMFVALLIAFSDSWIIVLALEIIGLFYILLGLTAKYAFYPVEPGLLPAIAIALSIFAPPLMLVSIPYFYSKSKRNLLLYK